MLNDRSFKSRTLISIATWRLSSLKSSGPVCCVPCSLQTFLTLFLPDQLCALEVPFHSWQSVSSILKCHNTFGKLNVDHVSYEFYMKFVHKKKKIWFPFSFIFPFPNINAGLGWSPLLNSAVSLPLGSPWSACIVKTRLKDGCCIVLMYPQKKNAPKICRPLLMLEPCM